MKDLSPEAEALRARVFSGPQPEPAVINNGSNQRPLFCSPNIVHDSEEVVRAKQRIPVAASSDENPTAHTPVAETTSHSKRQKKYWSSLTLEQRSAEIKRRIAIARAKRSGTPPHSSN